jgi:hypothetical protein
MKLSFYFFLSLIFVSYAKAPAQKLIKSIPVNDEVTYATVDRPGEIYIVTKQGHIRRFDTNGNPVSEYKNQATPTLFDPRDGARLFGYFRQDQHYSYLSPSLEVTKSLPVEPSFAVEPWLLCISGDYNIWILDAGDMSLKRINGMSGTLEVDQKMDDTLIRKAADITFMREYQGFLFLLHQEKGILIFNKMGRWIKTIERLQLKYFNFLGEELYYPEGNHVKFLNLFTGETRTIPGSQTAQFILLTDERMYTLENANLNFFSLKP